MADKKKTVENNVGQEIGSGYLKPLKINTDEIRNSPKGYNNQYSKGK